jgi:hypothetical protein
MNRRDFIEGVVVGAAVARDLKLPQLLAAGEPDVLPRAHWLDNGLIDAGGDHEPFSFVVRRGGNSYEAARKHYEEAQSEEVIARLKEQGVEVFHTHLYKGFGMVAERPEMEDAKRVAEIVHRYGMRVNSYIQWNSMMYETFFAEEPRAKAWIQRDIQGLPLLLPYGYQQSYRYRPCFANQEYLDYLKKIVRYAVQEVKTDFIYFDNYDLYNPEPDSCHCPVCVNGFRNYLKTKYTPERRRERFGFENVDFVNPPQWNRQNPPERLEIIFDPAIQEWIDYRCQLMADALRQLALYTKSLDPEVVIQVNPHGITGGNRAFEAALDHARFLKWTEVLMTEEENPASWTSDGRLISKIRSYKLARRFNNVVVTYIWQDPVAMGECLSFNQTIGFAADDPLPPELVKYISFYRKNRDLYVGTVDVTPVGVLRSYPSITYHHALAQLSAILVEQALIQARVPFGLLFDEHLRDLSQYLVLVLPDSECLSDEQLSYIRRFVENGGGLVATGQSGLYDIWRRPHMKPGLRGLVDTQQSASEYEESVNTLSIPTGLPVRKELGKGRSVYIPGVVYDGPLPEPENYFNISNRFWKRPKNWEDIIDSIRWAAKGQIPVEIDGPEFLVANVVQQSMKQRLLIHLVNYNAQNVQAISSIDVKCQLPQGKTPREIKIVSPDEETPRALNFATQNSATLFTIPQVKVYSVVVVSW